MHFYKSSEISILTLKVKQLSTTVSVQHFLYLELFVKFGFISFVVSHVICNQTLTGVLCQR